MSRTATASQLLMRFGTTGGSTRSLLLHPAGGGLSQYLPLALELDRHGPVWGIRAAGLLPGEEPDSSVPAMLARYRAVIAGLPEPPNLLLGWSLGGVLAWELAADLDPRTRVVMIDSYPAPEPVDPAATAELRRRVADSVGTATGFDAERLRSTVDAHIAAALTHRVTRRHDGPALLLRCAAEDNTADLAAWLELGGELRVDTVPGGHFEVLREHGAAVTSRLRDFLRTTSGKEHR